MPTYGKQTSAGGGGGSGFSSHVTIAQPNGSAQQVNTLDLLNQYSNNVAGSETAQWLMTVPVNGTQVVMDLAKLNGAGKQTATTSGATPTVALLPRYAVLEITVGADTTSLTITGLDLDTDFRYVLTGDILGPSGPITMRPNGTANGCSEKGQYFGNGAVSGSAANATTGDFVVLDSNDSGTHGSFLTTIAGAAGARKFLQTDLFIVQGSPALYFQHIVGITNATTNVTSLVLPGTIKAGSVISLQRTLLSAA